ncbi:MAG: S4 domain-containing protein, partial [Nitrospirales bacterium]
GTDGLRKMSKSWGNYIALEDPPGEMFGKLMSISDALMLRYYELLTSEDLAKVRALHPMDAKVALAEQIVVRYHGTEAARDAKQDFQKKFRVREFPANPDAWITLTLSDIDDPLRPSITLIDVLQKTGLFQSKGEARRLIAQGGVEVDGVKQTESTVSLPLDEWHQYRLRIGKKKFAVTEFRRSKGMGSDYPWKFDSKNLTLTLRTNDPQQSYQIDLKKCRTSAEVLDWIMQVAGKSFVDDHILALLIHELNRLLYPQGNLCSLGTEQGPIDVKKVLHQRLKDKK